MLEPILKSFSQAKLQYDRLAARDSAIVCRAGAHMDCAVLKLQKAAWTNDDLSKMGNQTGIFFSIWVSEAGLERSRVDYNIHAMAVRKLKTYRLTGNAFCDEFRKAFEPVRKSWPNVSTDHGCRTLMQGWYELDRKSVVSDAVKLMTQFEKQLSPVIDGLLEKFCRAATTK